jgi:hypothetical protein
MRFTREKIETAVKNKKYVWFNDDDNEGFDLNIVGVRNNDKNVDDKVTNVFDDYLTVSYKENGKWVYKEWAITTDPGKRAMLEVKNPTGVARLVTGQYRSSHSIGLHRGKYEALRQTRPVKVYRDANKNMVFDENKTQEGLFGINIHKAGKNSTVVENWSEGCQVFKTEADFNEFMAICKRAAKIHGATFTYTLIETTDII